MSTATSGVLLKIASGVLFVAMVTIVKALSSRFPVGEIVFFRGVIASLILAAVLGVRGELNQLATRRPWLHVGRGFVGGSAMVFAFTSYHYLPLADAQTLAFLAPVFSVIIAFVVMGERLDVWRWLSLIIGFAGVGVVLTPHFSTSATACIGTLFGVGASLLTATALMQIQDLTKTETTAAIVFYFALNSTLLGLASLPLGWTWPSLSDAGLLLDLGAFGVAGHYCMTLAIGRTNMSVLAPLEYINLIWALMFGMLIFEEWPTADQLLGSSLIMASALLIWFANAAKTSPK
jgi:drug/metabolite transporter (DMT)-like permease